MHVHQTELTPTKIKLTITADQPLLDDIKNQILRKLQRDIKVPGFRTGKVPLEMVARQADQQVLQSEFLDAALNKLYGAAILEQNIRPVASPQVNVTKFVPFTTLEFDAEVDAVGSVTLPDYTKIKLSRKPVTITDKDVDDIVENLRLRMAEKKPVDRPAQPNDEVWIDFSGRDAQTKEPIEGADGKEYPLILGSNTFIPGFEKNLKGVSAGDTREFDLEFPKDYGVKALQGRNVSFTVTVTKVHEVVLPEADDEFAAKAGPFKSYKDLVSDIRKQLESERQYQADRDYESELLSKITDKATVPIPESLIDEELDRVEQEERQNVMYRGQTWEEHLAAEGVTEAEHRTRNRAGAELRVKAGLVLAEIAEKEKIDVSADEVDVRVQLLKGQYQDQAMQAELDKKENRREIASRILSEKTLRKLQTYAAAN